MSLLIYINIYKLNFSVKNCSVFFQTNYLISTFFLSLYGYYLTGEGDSVWCVEGESPDYTACSSDGCGYCGRCSY